jgi:hypothetical protein
MSKLPTFPESTCQHLAGGEANTSIGRRRFHQSWYRRCVLGLDPGPNPHAKGALYGNMLQSTAGVTGMNFLTGDIFGLAKTRFPLHRQDPGTARLYHNLLASTPMCFNLFGCLTSDLRLANRLLRALPDVPSDIEVTRVRFEYAPPKANHLQDATSFDAFIEYKRPDSRCGFSALRRNTPSPSVGSTTR